MSHRDSGLHAPQPLVLLTPEQLEQLIVIAVRKATGREAGLIDQRHSPLGKVGHGRAVRRRIAEQEDGAFRVGRDYLLTPEALREELARLNEAGRDGANDSATDVDADRVRGEIEAKLRLVRGKKK
jgi:hypothetical protein